MTERAALRVSRREFFGGLGAVGAVLLVPPSAAAQSVGAAAAVVHSDAPDDAAWSRVRARFDLDPELAHLNTGTLGAAWTSVRETRAEVELALAADPGSTLLDAAALDAVRRAAAGLVNGSPDEIVLTRSTTEGLNLFSRGLELQPGDEVVIGSEEHNAAIAPYRALERRIGIRIVRVDLPPAETLDIERIVDAYRRALTPRSRVLVASHVTYRSGLVLPIAELAALARSRGVLISVDGAQSFGVLPLDVAALDLDHYAAPGQKWLLAGTGTGIAWLRRELQGRVHPLYGDYDPSSESPFEHTARRYERTGQRNVPAIHSLGRAIAEHSDIGLARIQARIDELAARVRIGLAEIDGFKVRTPANPTLTAGITSFIPGALPPEKLVGALRERRIIVRTIPLGEQVGVRVSTHFYNTPDEVDRLLAALREFAADPSRLA